jgi:hypothetical protein
MVDQIPRGAAAMLAKRERRMHHYLWHSTRNSWLRYDNVTRDTLRALGWEPPRPAFDGNGNAIIDNHSGEDFLFMHRKMIAAMDAKLAQITDQSYPRVMGWQSIPKPGDQDYPVPPAYGAGRLGQVTTLLKSDQFFRDNFEPAEQRLTNSQVLATMTLGELGASLEHEIHNWMHMRWSSEPARFRPNSPPDTPESIDPAFDAVSYDWLGDTYSSHVHSVFWKLHGWIDDRITDWKRAHNITGPIKWKGNWVGPMPEHPSPDTLHALMTSDPEMRDPDGPHGRGDHDHIAAMEQAIRSIAKCGVHFHFYDEIAVA